MRGPLLHRSLVGREQQRVGSVLSKRRAKRQSRQRPRPAHARQAGSHKRNKELTLAAAKLGKGRGREPAQINAQNSDDPLETCRKLRRWRHPLRRPHKTPGTPGTVIEGGKSSLPAQEPI